jgi:hypothetical protein
MVKSLMFVGILLSGLPVQAVAQDDRYYQGSSGMRYQYDLSSPMGQLNYSVDPMAQLRDQMNIDPRVQIDQGMGQYGGGAYQGW